MSHTADKEPEKSPKAASARTNHESEKPEVQEADADRSAAAGRPAEAQVEVADADADKDGEPVSKKVGELHAFGGKVYVQVDGEFSRDDVFVFSQQLESAFQTVA